MILDRIVAHKKKEIEENKSRIPEDILRTECSALCHRQDNESCSARVLSRALRKPGEVALIAEIKKASPSKGLIREKFDPVEIAGIYSGAGASAISVLTDREFFQGSPDFLKAVREVSSLPLLRKDFVIDPYQIYEAKLLGANAILLIMAILTDNEAQSFQQVAAGLGLECLVEVHTGEELKRAIDLDAQIIGINNRDLKTFKTDLATTFRLRAVITDPAVTVVSESGINTRADVLRLREHDVHAMLVGEALMREKDIGLKAAELLGGDGGYSKVPGEMTL